MDFFDGLMGSEFCEGKQMKISFFLRERYFIFKTKKIYVQHHIHNTHLRVGGGGIRHILVCSLYLVFETTSALLTISRWSLCFAIF